MERTIKPSLSSIQRALDAHERKQNRGVYAKCEDNGVHLVTDIEEIDGELYAATPVGVRKIEKEVKVYE